MLLMLLLFVSPYTRQQLVVRWLVEIYIIIIMLSDDDNNDNNNKYEGNDRR